LFVPKDYYLDYDPAPTRTKLGEALSADFQEPKDKGVTDLLWGKRSDYDVSLAQKAISKDKAFFKEHFFALEIVTDYISKKCLKYKKLYAKPLKLLEILYLSIGIGFLVVTLLNGLFNFSEIPSLFPEMLSSEKLSGIFDCIQYFYCIMVISVYIIAPKQIFDMYKQGFDNISLTGAALSIYVIA
jgi:hypothetical protein